MDPSGITYTTKQRCEIRGSPASTSELCPWHLSSALCWTSGKAMGNGAFRVSVCVCVTEGRTGFQLAVQVLSFRIINVLPYFQFNYKQFMAQSRAPVITANHTFERGCRQELSSAEGEGWDKATQVCTAGSLTSYYLRKKKLCKCTQTSARQEEEAEGSGGRIPLEGISGSISGYKPYLLVLPRGRCHDHRSLGKYWGEYSYAHIRLTIQPTGAADRISRHFFMSTACFLHAYRNWVRRKVFCALTNKLSVSE